MLLLHTPDQQSLGVSSPELRHELIHSWSLDKGMTTIGEIWILESWYVIRIEPKYL